MKNTMGLSKDGKSEIQDDGISDKGADQQNKKGSKPKRTGKRRVYKFVGDRLEVNESQHES